MSDTVNIGIKRNGTVAEIEFDDGVTLRVVGDLARWEYGA
jgi:hypothetical protein